MLMTSDIKGGTVFKNGNDVVVVQRMLGIKGGPQRQVKRLRVKSILTGSTMELGLDMGEKFEDVSLDYHKMKLSYVDGETWVFMDQESFEQYELTKEDLGDNVGYISPDDDYPRSRSPSTRASPSASPSPILVDAHPSPTASPA